MRPDGVSNRQGDCESIPPDAVLWDRQNPALVYAFSTPDTAAKLIVRLDYVQKVRHLDQR